MMIQIVTVAVLAAILILSFVLLYKRYGKDWFKKHKKAVIAVTTSTIIVGGIILLPLQVEIDFGSGNVWFASSLRNAYFTTNTSRDFSVIQITSDYTKFNDTIFRVDAGSRINVTLMQLDNDYLAFYATYGSGNVWFNITNSNYVNGSTYNLSVGGVFIEVLTVSANRISFNYSSWSTKFFELDKDSNQAPVITDYYPSHYQTSVELQPVCNVTINDPDGDSMTVIWEEFQTPIWVETQRNTSVYNGTYSWIFVNATEYNTGYTFRVTVTDGLLEDEAQVFFTTEMDSYNITIRNNGIDYFIWLGQNLSAWHVAQEIAGFDGSDEYISIWDATSWNQYGDGCWVRYYGNGAGANFSISTFDVVKVYLDDSGTQQVNMTANPNINYDAQRSVYIYNLSRNKGYNYTGYSSAMPNTLGGINGTNITLSAGSHISVWNRTTYEWVTFIAYFGMNSAETVERWAVMETKVQQTRNWVI